MTKDIFSPIKLLQFVLLVLEYSQDSQKKVINNFQTLFTQRLTLALLDKIKNKEGVENLVNDLSVESDDKNIFDQNLEKIAKFCGENLTDEEKRDIYFLPLLTTFLDIVSVLSENTSSENKIKIRDILTKDQGFKEIYKAWQQATLI